MKNTSLKIASVSLLASSILLGANVPNISDIEKDTKVPNIKKEKIEIPQFETKTYKAPMADSGKKVLINGFSFSGNENIKSEELQDLTKDYANKNLTFTQISELTAKITRYYRSKGYFVARAYVPVQNLKASKNVLEIAIIEGNYGEFLLNNNSLVKDEVVQAMLDDAKNRGDIISTDTLERVMLIINDTPGVVVTQADVMPGKKVATSDFDMQTQASKAFDGYIVVDNTGGKNTGKNRFIVGLNANSPFKIGDKLSFTGLTTNGFDLKNGRLAYSMPLMPNGLRGEVSYSHTTYSLVKLSGVADDVYTGDSKTTNLNLTYPIKRTRLENLYASMDVSHKDLNDEFSGTKINPRSIKSINLGLAYDKNYLAYGLNSVSEVGFNFTYGNLSFDEASDKSTNKAGVDTEGNYSKVNLNLSNVLELTPKVTLDTRLNMQYALSDKNLDGTEDLSLGGTDGVKLYPSGEFSAENGYVFNAELKYTLPTTNGISSRVGIFYDYANAFISNDDNNSISVSRESLQDVGLGYYLNYKDYFAKLQVAWKANSKDVTTEKERNSRIIFQAGWSF